MAINSRIACKVCGKGEIISITEYHQEWESVTWRKHFFGGTSYFEALVNRRSWFQRLLIRIKRPRNTHTTTSNYCNVCGVRYEFVPAQNLLAPVTLVGAIQIAPGLWLAEKSSSIFAKS